MSSSCLSWSIKAKPSHLDRLNSTSSPLVLSFFFHSHPKPFKPKPNLSWLGHWGCFSVSQADPDFPHSCVFNSFVFEPNSFLMSPVKSLSAEDVEDMDLGPLSGLTWLSVMPSRESPALAPSWKTLRTDGVSGSTTAQL